MLSLDGVAEEPSDWLSDSGPELIANLGRTIKSQDDILLGRGTYDYWVGYWPTSDVEPFASFINGTQKHVFASTEPEASWDNSTIVTTPAVDYVKQMKQRTGGDIGIHGSISLTQSLLRARLVDELRLVIAPSLAGGGRRLFADEEIRGDLELMDVARSDAGTLFLGYHRSG
ncbi:MAG: dihydrofolate reductase family protein [Solirubrobacterales bacterium]